MAARCTYRLDAHAQYLAIRNHKQQLLDKRYTEATSEYLPLEVLPRAQRRR